MGRPWGTVAAGGLARWTRPPEGSGLVVAVLAVAVLVRLPFLSVLPSPDEAGLLVVAGQWQPGTSLYGDYWVDRPPLLMLAFEVADATGGLVALRVLGILAMAATVVLCAATAGRLGGPRARTWAAVAAAVLTVSPWLGADRVNAELLAAPWIALGVHASVRAVQGADPRWAVLAGATVAAAVATKQNLVDGGVFLLALLVVSVVVGELRARTAWRFVAAAAVGAVGLAILLLGWAWLRGTAPGDLLDALFAFRVRAAEAMAAAPSPSAQDRRWEVLTRSVASGQLVLLVAVVVAPFVRRLRSTAAIALALTAVAACVSVAGGGSWWNHYLVQLAVPVAVGTGLIAARTRIAVPAVLAYAVASAVVGAGIVRPALTVPDAPYAAGRMIAEVARPSDTVIHAWGRPDLVIASGLTSPYEQLWSLPVRTDDPRLARFRSVLEGPRAPTWVVTRGTLRGPGLSTAAATRVLRALYRPVAGVCDLEIMLRRDVHRPTPPPLDRVSCKASSVLR